MEFFFSLPPRPDRHWGPSSHLPNGNRGTVTLGVKRPGREAEHSPPSNPEVKNLWSCTSIPTIRVHGAVLNLAKKTSSWHGATLGTGAALS
jgi:hypothetical protein